jgi:hypothetical protein
MLGTTPVRDDDRLTPPIQRYLRWLAVSMFTYVTLLVCSLFALRQVPADALVARAALGLLPVLPLLLLVWAFARYIRETDEMQRLIELQSLAAATAIVGIGYLAAGFLASAGVVAFRGADAAILVLPALFGAYGIAKAFVQRSYR